MIPTKPYKQKNWYVVYTKSRAEKKVYDDLIASNIECFLPLQKKLRQWKDRKKWVDIPLIPGYCFVHISRKAYDKVLTNPNVVCYITFEGKAAIVSQEQIDTLKHMLQQTDFEVDVTHENFEPGQKVEIIEEPLVGLQGELIDYRGKNRFILRLQQINTIFVVEIQAKNITYLSK